MNAVASDKLCRSAINSWPKHGWGR